MKRIIKLILLFYFISPVNISAQKPSLHILSIGMSEYQLAQLNLRFGRQDADDLAQAFYNQQMLWEIKSLNILLNQQATRNAILNALDQLGKEASSNDFIVVIFSGHGSINNIIPYDYSPNNPDSTSIHRDTLFHRIGRFPCGYMVIYDACYSASMIKSVGSKDLNVEELRAEDMKAALLSITSALSAQDKPSFIYASSSSAKRSWECESCKHGYLVQGFLDAAINKPLSTGQYADNNRDGFINAYELDDYVKQFVKISAAIEQDTQYVYSKIFFSEKFPLLKTISLSDTRDSDGDRLYDIVDACPNEAGTILTKGCKDAFPPSYIEPLCGSFYKIKGGIFLMGKNGTSTDEYPVHAVTLSDFYIGQTEVTRSQWHQVLGLSKPDNCAECPMTNISWNEVQVFLDSLFLKTNIRYRLPTEAEWEYVATQSITDGYAMKSVGVDSSIMHQIAWYNANSRNSLHPVKSKAGSNVFGLFDLFGNAWEWCSDWYDYRYYRNSESENPTGPATGREKVKRGGSFTSSIQGCQITNRGYAAPESKSTDTGFRIARTIPGNNPPK